MWRASPRAPAGRHGRAVRGNWRLALKIILFLFALIIVVSCLLMLIRTWTPPKPKELPGDSAKAILKRRYAAGEIDEDEYLRRMSGISQDW